MKLKLLILLISVSICSLSAQDVWKTIDKNGYTFEYLSTWTLNDTNDNPNVDFMLMSKASQTSSNQFSANINLIRQDISAYSLDLKAYTDLSVDQIKQQFTGSTFDYIKTEKIHSEEASVLVFSTTTNDQLIKFKQIYIVKGDFAYVITFTSLGSDFDDYIDTIDKMLYSFKLKK